MKYAVLFVMLLLAPFKALAGRPLTYSEVDLITSKIHKYAKPKDFDLPKAQKVIAALYDQAKRRPSGVSFTKYAPCVSETAIAVESCIGTQVVVGMNGDNYEISAYRILDTDIGSDTVMNAKEAFSLCYGTDCTTGDKAGYYFGTPGLHNTYIENTTYFTSESMELESGSEDAIWFIGAMVGAVKGKLQFGITRHEKIMFFETPICPKHIPDPCYGTKVRTFYEYGPKW